MEPRRGENWTSSTLSALLSRRCVSLRSSSPLLNPAYYRACCLEYRALETYNFKRSIGRQGPALECSLTVLGGSEDDFLGEGVAEQVLGRWREATSADCSVQVFAGAGHFYWKHSDELEEQFLESVVEKLFEADQRGGAGAKGPLDIVSSFTDALPDIAEE